MESAETNFFDIPKFFSMILRTSINGRRTALRIDCPILKDSQNEDE
jgi:hypothetical protein